MNNKQAGEPVAEASRPSTDSPSSRGSDVTPSSEGPSAASLESGPASLPDFELLAEIGRGGFGSVWIAKHRHTGDAVAIKFIPPRSRETELKGLQMLRQRVREGQDHLVWTEYIGEAGEFIYCVMDLADNVVDGPLFPDRYEALTLFKYLKQRGRLDLADAHEVVRSMAKGLSFLQQVGLRHGDVKPANVLRVRGKWKLADYGMMGGLDARARGGTRSYVPPEGPHGERADQYALGIVLHELVFGQKPSNSTSTWPSSRLGTGLRRVCERMLDAESTRRYASLSEVVEALDSLGARRAGNTVGTSACPHCGEAVDGEQEVCGGCGGDLWQTCPACEHRGSVLQRFCTRCRAPVHAIATLEQELAEAAALLPEGRHREVVSRAEGPLADLCNEVDHQLSKMQGGDLARSRRAGELRQRLDGRRRQMLAQAKDLQAVDDRIATAHAEGLVTELRAAVESALHLLPESERYRKLRAELPRLEAQASWNALLAELGNPQRDPSRIGGRELRRVIRAIRMRTPDDPDVRIEASRLVDRLLGEQTRRLRESCRRRAARHREAGRPIEALEALRRAESSGAADDVVLEEIRELVDELAVDRLPSLLDLLGGGGSMSMPHGRMRRAIREVEAIRPSEAKLASWKTEWMGRRRRELLRRIKDRCLVSMAMEDSRGWQRLLALAYRIAGRDPALASRVLELDNALQARWNTYLQASRDAASAEVAGDAIVAYEKWQQASAIASRSPQVLARLEAARIAAEAYPRRRRRRLTVLALVSLVLLSALGTVAWQAWNWRQVDLWLRDADAGRSTNVAEFAAQRRLIEDRGRLPLGTWGLDTRMIEVWQSQVEDGLITARSGLDPQARQLEDLAALMKALADLGASQRAWLDDRLIEEIDRVEDAGRPDPEGLHRLDLLIARIGSPAGARERFDGVAGEAISRLEEEESSLVLGSWWLVVERGLDPDAESDTFADRVKSAFARRDERDFEAVTRLATSLDLEIGDALRRGRIEETAAFAEAAELLSRNAATWASERVLEARDAVSGQIARIDHIRRGRIELELPGVGPTGFRVLEIDGVGVLVADRQVGSEAWADWSGKVAAGGTGDAVNNLPVEEVRGILSGLVIDLSTVRLRATVPDPERWTEIDRRLRDRGDGGIRQESDTLDDLAIRTQGGSTRAYAMPNGFPTLSSGSPDVGLRLFLSVE